jgi:hypothetical protein
MLDVKSNELFYDCFNFETFTTGCSKKIDHWLQDYNKINTYYQKDKLLRSNYFNKDNPEDLIKFQVFLILYILFFYVFILGLYVFYFFIQEFVSSYRRRMQGYILIQ